MARTHAELTDSAVKAILNHYLDSLAALPGGGRLLPPPGRPRSAAQEYGLDGNYMTVAGLKIPALVLGLIPLPVGGNESKALDKGRVDAGAGLRAGAAAAGGGRADQREQIKALRERVAAEQELRRRQRVPPLEATVE